MQTSLKKMVFFHKGDVADDTHSLSRVALTVDGPVTSAEKLAWPGPRRRAGPLGSGPASGFWSVAPLEMGSIS